MEPARETRRPRLHASLRDRLGLLLEQAAGLPSAELARFLDEACGEDAALRRELDSLVAALDSSSGFFEGLAERLLPRTLDAVAEAGNGEASDDDAAADVVASGQRVSHYEVLERVGRGGMGIVYRARDVRLGRHVALKFLPAQRTADAGARARLVAEARAASALDHPNIGVVHDIGRSPACSRRRTRRASCTATSSHPTSSSRRRTRRSWWTSASRRSRAGS